MVGPGTNNGGGGFKIQLPYKMSEVWVRFYMRHQLGFRWQYDQPHYEKDLYFNDAMANAAVFVFGYANGYFGVHKVSPGSDHLAATSSAGSWQGINRGPAGDGQWHSYEVHAKMDTNGSNGIAETWVDGVQVARFTNVNWNGSIGWSAWQFFTVAINQNVVANTVDMYRDYDDFAVSGSGYIGPIGGGGQSSSTLPAAPVNLRIAP